VFVSPIFFLTYCAYAEKPYNITDAKLVEKGVLHLDFGGDYSRDNRLKEFIKAPEIGFRVGLGSVEFGLLFYGAYINDRNSYEDYDRGDLYISTKIRLTGEKKFFPYLILVSEVKVPTAADQKNIGTDETDCFFKLAGMKKVGKIRLNAEIGIEILGDPEFNQSQDDGFIYGIMWEYFFDERLAVAMEFYGDILEGKRNSASLTGCLVFKTNNEVNIYAGLRKGLNEKTEDWGGYLGLSYSLNFFGHPQLGDRYH